MEGDVGLKFCINCKRDVPEANFIMHSVHCQRKLGVCAKCKEAVPHSDLANHNATVHAKIACPKCGVNLEQMDLKEHERTLCNRRVICCAYCHMETEAKELAEHENYCGSRTEKCEECGEFVMLKYRQLHEDSNHGFLKLDDEPGPTASWNKPVRAMSALSNDLSRQRKVLNTTQDRPAAPANRLSPSKRTNDMPQINTAAAAARTKALHKPTLQKVTIPDDPIKRTVDSEANPYAAASRLMENMSLSQEMVALPCEFCEAMIPADQLVMHETGCRPDLACFKKPATVCDEPGLPCEFCGGLYSPYKLLTHQAVCEITPRGDHGSPILNQLGLPTRDGGLPLKQLNKPVANVNPVQPDVGQSVAVSHMVSTGAVPKQKAGNTLATLREIGQEVPRPPPSAMSQHRSKNTDSAW